jgi:hypothetical protein
MKYVPGCHVSIVALIRMMYKGPKDLLLYGGLVPAPAPDGRG